MLDTFHIYMNNGILLLIKYLKAGLIDKIKTYYILGNRKSPYFCAATSQNNDSG